MDYPRSTFAMLETQCQCHQHHLLVFASVSAFKFKCIRILYQLAWSIVCVCVAPPG